MVGSFKTSRKHYWFTLMNKKWCCGFLVCFVILTHYAKICPGTKFRMNWVKNGEETGKGRRRQIEERSWPVSCANDFCCRSRHFILTQPKVVGRFNSAPQQFPRGFATGVTLGFTAKTRTCTSQRTLFIYLFFSQWQFVKTEFLIF